MPYTRISHIISLSPESLQMVASMRVFRMCGAAAAVAEVVQQTVVVAVAARVRRPRQRVLILEPQSLAFEHCLHARLCVVRQQTGSAARSARRASLASRSGGSGSDISRTGRRPTSGRRLAAASAAIAARSDATDLFGRAAGAITDRTRLAPVLRVAITNEMYVYSMK